MILCNNFALNYEKVGPATSPDSDRGARVGDGDAISEETDEPDTTKLESHFGKVCGGRVLYISASFFNHSCR